MIATDNRSAAELVFEDYLRSQGLQWEYENHSGSKQPDYTLNHPFGKCIFEVKEIKDPDPKPKSGEGFSPDQPVRAKIRTASRQFREYKQHSCSLVLYTESMFGPHDPDIVLSAAFGPGLQRATDDRKLDPRPPAYRFLRRSDLSPKLHFLANAQLSPAANRTFSALVLLTRYQLDDFRLEVWRRLYARQESGEVLDGSEQFHVASALAKTTPRTLRFEGTIRVIVIENRHARISLPADMFHGPFDQRWGWNEEWCGPVWMGNTLESLYNSGVPFHML